MISYTKELEINATTEKIWNILTDFNNLIDWMSEVTNSYINLDAKIGVGTMYTIKFEDDDPEQWEIVYWNKNEKLASLFAKGWGPVKNFRIEWLLKPVGNSTQVSCTMEYERKWSFIGYIMNLVFFAPYFRKEVGKFVSGLKHFTETGKKRTTSGRERISRVHYRGNDRSQIATKTQSDDIYGSLTTTPNKSKSMFSSKVDTSDQYCKKCYGGLNEEGICNQCDKKW